MTQPHLCAHVTDVVDGPEVNLEVAYQNPDGGWYTTDGWRIWPFWTQEISLDIIPAIPDGWIEHLHEEAVKFAVGRRAPDMNLGALLGLSIAPPAQAPIVRRF